MKSYFRTINSEWIKIRTLKSFWITLLLSFVTCVVVAGLLALVDLKQLVYGDKIFSIWSTTLQNAQFITYILPVFAILTITSEYTFRTISTSLMAVPNRLKMLLSKAIVIFMFSFVVTIAVEICSFLTTYFAFPKYRTEDTFMKDFLVQFPQAFSVMLSIVLITMIAFFLGVILRNSTAAVLTFFVVLVTIPQLLVSIGRVINLGVLATMGNLMPDSLVRVIAHFSAINFPEDVTTGTLGYVPSFPEALLALVAWVVVLGLAGMAMFKERDV